MDVVHNLLSLCNYEVSSVSVSLSLFFVFLGLLSWYSVYPFTILSRCGIKHPRPIPFYGNLFMFRQLRRSGVSMDCGCGHLVRQLPITENSDAQDGPTHGFFYPVNDLIRKYGKVCGYYFARRPVVVIADPDMLRQVMVKDFKSFPNRNTFRFATKPTTDCLLVLRNEQWKRVRSVLTPTFSAAKMKEMVPLINTHVNALMNNFDVHAESGEAFDIHKSFGCFTMDVIASVAFATHLDSQNNPDNPFVHFAQMFFSFTFFRPMILFFIAFPTVTALLAKFLPNKRRDQTNQFFISTIQKIILQREEQPPEQRRRDFLQLMLDARTSKEVVSLEHFDTGTHADGMQSENRTHQQTTQPSASDQPPEAPAIRRTQKKMMTEDEITGQAFVFLLAGYETSSNALAFTCYLLAIHPQCQRKVQEELDEFFTRYSSPDYTNVQELKYLEMVLCESLRLYPPVSRYAREIEEDCVVNGQALPKGAYLEIPASFLHRDPEHWPEPESFIPERFTPEAKASRHPFVYLPFGAGPRNCVGMRLAQLEVKMALVRLFHRFNIVACSETQVPLELKSFNTLGPKNGIFVKIEKRHTVDG